MDTEAHAPISVVAADDNEHVLQAVRIKLSLTGGFAWHSGLGRADSLPQLVASVRPDIVLLDIDMPGEDPFLVLEELSRCTPASRVLIFSGHVRKDLVDRAIEAGTWGYISKSDGENALVDAIREVARGEFVLSREVRTVCSTAS